jgi:hypothetical protein
VPLGEDKIIIERSNERRYDGRGMWHVWGRREVHSESRWENPKEERDHVEDLGVHWRIIMKFDL